MESKSSSLFVSWQPGNYQPTAKRTEDAFQACNDIVACFQERARVERQYAQQLSEWSNKWKPVVDSSKISNRNTCDERGNELISKSCPNYYWNTTVILMVSSSPPPSLRSSIRLSYEGLAVFSVLRRQACRPTRHHLSLPGVGGWGPGQDLAEGHFPQEVIWGFQGVPRHWDGVCTCSEAVGQTT